MRHLATVTLALLLALGTYQAKAATYDVFGTFANGATLTGSMSLNNGLLLAIDLSDSGALPGTGILIHGDSVICATAFCGPTHFVYFEDFTGTDEIDETFGDATQVYSFYFYGGGSYAYLDLVFQLIDGGGTILGGKIWDPACYPNCDFDPFEVALTGGTLSAVPIPAALPLFAGGLGLLGWMARRRRGLAAHA